MYGMKPIINQLVSQLYTEYENGVMKAVQSCGFDVDKDRLAQALRDAEKFYMEGYHDAMTNHDVVKVVRCKDCIHYNLYRLECHNEHMNGVINFDGFCSYGERRSHQDSHEPL